MSNKATHVALVLDVSGSMDQDEITKAAYLQVQALREYDDRSGKVEVSIVTYCHSAQQPRIIDLYDPRGDSLGQMYNLVRYTAGGTATYRAIRTAIEHLMEFDNRASNVSFMVMNLTDGDDNQSRAGDSPWLKKMVPRLRESGNWSFGGVLVHSYGQYPTRQTGFDAHDVLNTKVMGDAEIKRALGRFMDARSHNLQSIQETMT